MSVSRETTVEYQPCGNPECPRLVVGSSKFCCLWCARAAEDGWEIEEHLHSPECDERWILRMPDDEVVRGRNDMAMMRRPHLWPYPHLFIKRDSQEHGYQTAILLSAFMEGQLAVLVDYFSERETTRLLYETYEAIVADGWMVD